MNVVKQMKNEQSLVRLGFSFSDTGKASLILEDEGNEKVLATFRAASMNSVPQKYIDKLESTALELIGAGYVDVPREEEDLGDPVMFWTLKLENTEDSDLTEKTEQVNILEMAADEVMAILGQPRNANQLLTTTGLCIEWSDEPANNAVSRTKTKGSGSVCAKQTTGIVAMLKLRDLLIEKKSRFNLKIVLAGDTENDAKAVSSFKSSAHAIDAVFGDNPEIIEIAERFGYSTKGLSLRSIRSESDFYF